MPLLSICHYYFADAIDNMPPCFFAMPLRWLIQHRLMPSRLHDADTLVALLMLIEIPMLSAATVS